MENSKEIKKLGVLTSGGDSPGMNAAIRAVVRTAIHKNIEVVGVYRGYNGLISKDFKKLESHSVSQKISLGGTFLKSSRCPEFKEKSYREIAVNNMREEGIDALVVIGGDGSFRGADLIHKEFGFPVVGLPGTIDNDIYGTDFTIGFDTAINTAVHAIDKIRDTAGSHNLVFFVEVMGRHSGFIGLYTGIGTGAEIALIPEVDNEINEICRYLDNERRNSKTSGIVVVAEGHKAGDAHQIAYQVGKRLPEYETRVTTLGHIQRGGSPSCNDRVLASILGNDAVTALMNGETGVMVGQMNGKIVYTPLEAAYTKNNEINKSWYEIARILSL